MIIVREGPRMQSMETHRTVPTNSIKVGSRHRKEMGDLQGLADSIAAEGLLQPIGVTEGLDLVFGERRLRAVRDILKRDTIDIRIVKVSSIVSGEMAENEVRKDFTPSERVAIADAVRQQVGHRPGQRTELRDDGPEVGTRTRDIAAQRAGFGSGKQLERAENVVRLGVPKLVERMDKGEVSITAAATIAKATPAVQEVVVSLPSSEQREAVARLKDDADRARRAADEQENQTGPTAYTGFLKKNGRMPSAEEAKALAKLDFRETPDASGKRHSPVAPPTKEQKAAEKHKDHVRQTVWHMFKGTSHLAACDASPAEAAAMVYKHEEISVEEDLEKALTWLSAFQKEWKRRGK